MRFSPIEIPPCGGSRWIGTLKRRSSNNNHLIPNIGLLMKTGIVAVTGVFLFLVIALTHRLDAQHPQQAVDAHNLRRSVSPQLADFAASLPRVTLPDVEANTHGQANNIDTTETDDIALRQVVKDLLMRVEKLERELSVLKERKPKVELLRHGK